MSDSPYKLSISLNVLNHLGLNLYSNIPAVLSETIANAWDADAKSVNVDFDIKNKTITIRDDGCGMDEDDINRKYLKVGYQKRNGPQPELTTPGGRKPMGRKGIGKLSLFSIANQVRVYSLKEGAEEQAFLLDAGEIRNAIQQEDFSQAGVYEPEKIDFDSEIQEHGTLIKLSDLKKLQLTDQIIKSLKKRIARRFCLTGDATGFEIRVDGEPVTFSDRDYFHKARFLFQYGNYDYSQHCTNLDTKNDAQAVFNRPKNHFGFDGEGSSDGDLQISGWIAMARHSNDLDSKGDNDNLNKISILVRKRVAQEDILQEFRLGGMFTKYLFGEIHADFLDDDGQDDIATSGRQRISEDDDRYKALKTFVDSELHFIWTETNKLKNNKGMEEAIATNPHVKEWYDKLRPRAVQQLARDVFGAIEQSSIDNDQKNNFYANGILATEALQLKTATDHMEMLDASNVDLFLDLLADIDAIEAARYHEIVRERLLVVRKLKEASDENARERVLQDYIFDHLWLLDPAWERATQFANMEEDVQTVIDDKLKKGRIDIYVKYRRVMAGHVIVELKRPEARKSKTDLEGQVQKYMDAVRQNLIGRNANEPLEAVCIVGKLPHGWDDLETRNKQEKSLKELSMRVITYDELIDNAYSAYSKFIEQRENVDTLTTLIEKVRDYTPKSLD